MDTNNLLYQNKIAINDFISIVIPTVGEVIDNQMDYYSMVSALTSSPIDFMAQLDEIGIDFTEINDYELFVLMFQGIKDSDSSLIFGDLDLSKFDIATRNEDGAMVIVDVEHNYVIDNKVYQQIAYTLRKIHNLKKDNRKPANNAAKAYMLERAKKKLKRSRRTSQPSQLESLIVAMVNTEQFKYDYDSVRNITIYQFNQSVHQIINKVSYDNRMIGVYTGNISVKDLDQKDLNWLEH